MDIEIRRTAPEERRAAANVVRVALLDSPPDDELWAKHEGRWQTLRSFSAWEGDRCVGHVGSFDVATTVPGGARVPTVAVTSAGILPTHAGRGIFRKLMAALHDDARSDGATLASLRASEATIYGHFDYGMAGDALTATIDAARATPLRGAATGGTFELVDPAELHEVIRPLYDAANARPGHISRPDWLWDRYFENVTGTTVENVVVHRAPDGTADGYLHYELKWSDDLFGEEHGTGTVHEVWATDPAAEVALWQFVLTIPLVQRLKVNELASDSVLVHAVRDFRAIDVGVRWDEQWVHLLDVDAALGARSWADAAPVVVEVDGQGRWRIGHGEASRTEDDPELRTGVAGIGAAYLGSTSWWTLVATGEATTLDPAAVARADAVFAHRPLAFSGSFF